jgi:hypothetical protein
MDKAEAKSVGLLPSSLLFCSKHGLYGSQGILCESTLPVSLI